MFYYICYFPISIKKKQTPLLQMYRKQKASYFEGHFISVFLISIKKKKTEETRYYLTQDKTKWGCNQQLIKRCFNDKCTNGTRYKKEEKISDDDKIITKKKQQ